MFLAPSVSLRGLTVVAPLSRRLVINLSPSKNTSDLKVGESNTETQQAAADESALTLF